MRQKISTVGLGFIVGWLVTTYFGGTGLAILIVTGLALYLIIDMAATGR